MPQQPQVENAPDDALPSGPGAAFTFLYYFSTVSFITALFTARTLGVGMVTDIPLQLALVGGTVAGTAGMFLNRTKTVELPFDDKTAFLKQLERALSEMGYSLDEKEETVSRYQRSNLSRLFSGDIYIQQRNTSIAVMSRAANVKRLQKRLDIK